MKHRLVLKILGPVYYRLPTRVRPVIKGIYFWSLMRLQSLAFVRKIYKGKRVEFIDFEIADLAMFEFLGPDSKEVLVEVYYSLVSPGTEGAVLRGLPGARFDFPFSPGYSAAGRVIKVGRLVRGLVPGDYVAGRISHCSRMSVDAGTLFKIPHGVSPEDAAFIELGIIVLQGIRKAKICPGDKVAVLGQGLIGQLANRLARVVGGTPIVALAPSHNREDTAKLHGGVDEYIAFGNDDTLLDKVKADIVIEAVGAPGAVATAMRCTRRGGRVVLMGSARGLGRDVDLFSLAQSKELQFVGAHISVMPEQDCSEARWTYRQEGELFLELLQQQRLCVNDLVTRRAKPEQCNNVYEVLAKGGGRDVGILFEWNADS
jgi:2-desacetyl-2-hydroxyethyl bacteriochlorophyllide A dehydrogenase